MNSIISNIKGIKWSKINSDINAFVKNPYVRLGLSLVALAIFLWMKVSTFLFIALYTVLFALLALVGLTAWDVYKYSRRNKVSAVINANSRRVA